MFNLIMTKKRFSFYIPPSFEETWNTFISIVVPKAERAYRDRTKLEMQKRKSTVGYSYQFRKKDFIAITIRDMITAVVNNAKKKLLEEHNQKEAMQPQEPMQ